MSNMKSNQPRKEIKAVELMREIREKLSAKYRTHPEQEDQELSAIREKYHIRETTDA